MNLAQRLTTLTSIYENLHGSLFTNNKTKTKVSSEVLESVTASIIAPGPFYYFVFDCHSKEIIYANPSVSDFYKITPEQFTVATIMEHIHPEDAAHLFACETSAGEFLLNHTSRKDLPHYKVSHCFRLRTKEGIYKMILHQGVTLSVDSEGLLDQTMLIHSDISHITGENNKLYSLIGLNGRPSYINIDPYSQNDKTKGEKSIFSEREKDVLRLLANGLSAQQIAEKLFISYNTVRTHKQNLLKKANVKNSNELLTKAIEMKVI